MYNVLKEVIFIKRKEITFIVSFISFFGFGLGLFLFIEGKLFEASISLSFSLFLFLLILILSFKKSKDDINHEDHSKENNKLTLIKQKPIDSVIKDDKVNKMKVEELDINSDQKLIDNNDNNPSKVEPIVDYITLKMTQTHFENLNSLIDQLEQENLIKDNEAFLNGFDVKEKVYAKLFPKIPTINVIKDKRTGYKVLGGINVQAIYELGQIHDKDLPYVKEVYPRTKNLVGMIEGGKLKDFDTEPPSQKFLPYRIKIKFYQ